jgi:hypothetical protein
VRAHAPRTPGCRARCIRCDGGAAAFRQFSVRRGLLPRLRGEDAALSCSLPDGNHIAEVYVSHAPLGNGPILAPDGRRACRLCDRPAGGALGARARHARRVLERYGRADLQRARGRSGRWIEAASERSLALSVRCGLHHGGLQPAFRCATDRGAHPWCRCPGRAFAMRQPCDSEAGVPRPADSPRSSDGLTLRSSRAARETCCSRPRVRERSAWSRR